MIDELPIPRRDLTYLWDDYYVRVLGYQRHASGFQVVCRICGVHRVITAGLSEFMRFAEPQPRY